MLASAWTAFFLYVGHLSAKPLFMMPLPNNYWINFTPMRNRLTPRVKLLLMKRWKESISPGLGKSISPLRRITKLVCVISPMARPTLLVYLSAPVKREIIKTCYCCAALRRLPTWWLAVCEPKTATCVFGAIITAPKCNYRF